MTLTIVLEPGDDNDIWGYVSEKNAFTIADVKDNVVELTESLRVLIQDFIDHEGQNNDVWRNQKASNLTFDYAYSVVGLFDAFKFLKIGEVAKAANLTPSLVRAYANGDKNPSLNQAKKIEEAIHRLGQSLLSVSVVPIPQSA